MHSDADRSPEVELKVPVGHACWSCPVPFGQKNPGGQMFLAEDESPATDRLGMQKYPRGTISFFII